MNPDIITALETMIQQGTLSMEKLQELGVIGQAQYQKLNDINDNSKQMSDLMEIIINLAQGVKQKQEDGVAVSKINGIETITIKGEQGEKGEKGDLPTKGTDYFTQEEIEDFLKEITPKKGVDYHDGEKGEQGEKGNTGERGEKGEPGQNGMHGENGKPGEKGADGQNGSPDTPEQIIEKIRKLPKGLKLSFEKDLIDTPDIQSEIKKEVSRASGLNIKYLKDLGDIDIVGQINNDTTDGWVLKWDFAKTKFVLGPGGSGGSLTGGANRIVYYDDDGNPTDDAQFTRLNNGKTLFGYTDGDGAVYENRLGGINIGFATNKDGIGATIVFGDKKAYNSTVNNSGNLTAILGVEEVDKRFAYNYVTDESIYDGVWDKETGEYSLSLQTKLGHVLTATDDLVSATEVATMFLDKKGLRFISDITGNSYYMPIGDEFDDADNGDVMTVNKSTGRVEFSAPTGGGISDAPSDGNTYGRKDASWVAVTGGGGSGMVIGDNVTGANTYRVLFTDINGDLSQSNSFLYNQDDVLALISLDMDSDLGKNQVKQLFGADRKTFGGLNFFGIQGSDSDTYTNALFGIADTTDVLGASGSTNSMFGQGSSKAGLTDEENAGIILNSGNYMTIQLEKIDTITDDTKWTIGISGAIESKEIAFEYINELSGSEAEIRFGLVENLATYEDAIAGKTWSLPTTFPTANGQAPIVSDYTTGETVWGQPKITSLDIPIYADNATAIIGGLVATQLYKTVTGEVRIVV